MNLGGGYSGGSRDSTVVNATSDEIADKVVCKIKSSTRAIKFHNHAVAVFGDIAKDPKERALRFLEEAVELAQAAGIGRDTTNAMTERVYGKPPGNVAEEIGQAFVTLELCGIAHHVNPEVAADYQLERFLSKPAEHWQARQAKKKALGITVDSGPPPRSSAGSEQQVKEALDLAVSLIMAGEPGDSRAVSDEAVALAAVACDDAPTATEAV